MKKIFILSLITFGLAFTASAQTQSNEAAGNTEVKKTEQEASTVVKKTDVSEKTTTAQTTTEPAKKHCAGQTSGCAKSGEVKSCCKAKAQTAGTSGAAEAGDKTVETKSDDVKVHKCAGEEKECCKKKAAAGSGS